MVVATHPASASARPQPTNARTATRRRSALGPSMRSPSSVPAAPREEREGVANAQQEQAVGGGGRAGASAVAAIEHLGDPSGGPAALTHLQERADHVPHHVVKEGI